MEKFIIYTDGGARGNPGPAALGVVIRDEHGKMLKEYGEALGSQTNNFAEYSAIISALKKLRQLVGRERGKKSAVEMRMDSELAARQLNGQYRIKEHDLIPLFIEVWNLKQDFGEVTFHHVRREDNRDADRMVNRALDAEDGTLAV